MEEGLSGLSLKVGLRMTVQYLPRMRRLNKKVVVMQIKRVMKELKTGKQMQQEFLKNLRLLRFLTQLKKLTYLVRVVKVTSGTPWNGTGLLRSSPGKDSLA